MSIIGGVGTAYVYSSFFNCIRMGWNQYKKITLNVTNFNKKNLDIKTLPKNVNVSLWASSLINDQDTNILCTCILLFVW
jgi:hypothetical protein